MGRIKEKSLRRGIITLYVRSRYRSLYWRFCELIKGDERFKQLRSKRSSGLQSVAVMQLIYEYVMRKDPSFTLTKSEQGDDESETD